MCLAVQRTRTCERGEERHTLLELLTPRAWQCSEPEPLRTRRWRRFFALLGVLCHSGHYVFKPDGTANPKLRSLRRQQTDYGKPDGRSQVTCREILSESRDSPIRSLRRDTLSTSFSILPLLKDSFASVLDEQITWLDRKFCTPSPRPTPTRH